MIFIEDPIEMQRKLSDILKISYDISWISSKFDENPKYFQKISRLRSFSPTDFYNCFCYVLKCVLALSTRWFAHLPPGHVNCSDSALSISTYARAGVRRSEPTSAGCTVTPQRTLRATRLAGQVRGAAGMAAERGTGTDRTGKRRGQQVRIYPCRKLNLAYLRNPHRKSNMQWISFKQKNYHLEKSIPVL